MKERIWKSILANEPYKYRSLSAAISKMVMRLLRHNDQDERDIDGAVHWNTMSPKFLRAFGHQEHDIFPQKIKLKHLHEGSNETRFEYCESSRNSLVCMRAIQGHIGVQMMAPDLMGHVAIPYSWKEFVFHRGWSFKPQLYSGNRSHFPDEKKAQREDTLSSSHLFTLLGKI